MDRMFFKDCFYFLFMSVYTYWCPLDLWELGLQAVVNFSAWAMGTILCKNSKYPYQLSSLSSPSKVSVCL